jgi:hypothetical protein
MNVLHSPTHLVVSTIFLLFRHSRCFLLSWLFVVPMEIAFGLQDDEILPIANGMYTPLSSVMDVSATDLDVRDISNFASAGDFELAYRLYQLGANSESYASLNLTRPTSKTLPAGSILTGYALDTDEPVTGTLKDDLLPGDMTITFVYDVSNAQPSLCRVGQLPESMQQLEGCLTDQGVLDIDQGGTLEAYTYNHLTNNLNGRWIQEFSLRAKEWMHDCESCPYRTYEKFLNYYGVFEYADEILSAAFGLTEKTQTEFTLGNLDFSLLGATGRTGM